MDLEETLEKLNRIIVQSDSILTLAEANETILSADTAMHMNVLLQLSDNMAHALLTIQAVFDCLPEYLANANATSLASKLNSGERYERQ